MGVVVVSVAVVVVKPLELLLARLAPTWNKNTICMDLSTVALVVTVTMTVANVVTVNRLFQG